MNLEELHKKEIVLVFDNFERIKKHEVRDFIVKLIAKMPSNLHFIILSRTKVLPEYKQFLLNDELFTITAEELQFTKAEITKLFTDNNCILNEDIINEIIKDTEACPILIKSILKNMMEQHEKSYNEEIQIKVQEDLNGYIEYKFWDFLNKETKEILSKIWFLDSITKETFCVSTGMEELSNALEEICGEALYLTKDKEEYVLCDSIKNFLKAKFLNVSNPSEIYNKIGLKYEELGQGEKAIQNYILADNKEKTASLLEEQIDISAGKMRCKDFCEYIYSVPEEYIEHSSTLCFALCIHNVMQNKIEESDKWFEKLLSFKDKIKKDTKEYNNFVRHIIMCCMFTPKMTLVKTMKVVKGIVQEYDITLENIIEDLSVTFNYPSVVSGIKDLTKFFKHIGLTKKYIQPALLKITGYDAEPLIDIGYGEFLFEQNNLSGAMYEIGNGIMKLANTANEKENLELLFVAHVISMRDCFIHNQLDLFEEKAEMLKKKLEENNETHLLDNFKAIYARFKLRTGDTRHTDNWLKNDAADITKNFNMAQQYNYTARIRIEISKQRYSNVLIALNMLEPFYRSCNRKYHLIENCILQAICFQRTGNKEMAMKYIEEAILLAQKYKMIRLFADEGLACYEVLSCYQKICNNPKINKNFLHEIIRGSQIFGEMYPSLYMENTKINLTKNEMKVIMLMQEGLKNTEIAERLNISIATVKTHINHIFAKLNVTSRVQAINAAKQKNII